MYTMLHWEKTCDYIADGKKCMNYWQITILMYRTTS